MKSIALFENGTTCEVVARLYQEVADEGLAGTTVIGAEGSTLLASARIGAYAAYDALHTLGLVDMRQGYHMVCQFVSELGGLSVEGRSVDLLFAVMFAGRLIELEAPEAIPFTVAATGIVTDITAQEVQSVEGIEAKIRGGLNALQRGDTLIYPAVNDEDVGDALKVQAEAQGVRLLPVRTVREAVQDLYASTDETVPLPDWTSQKLRPLASRDIRALSAARSLHLLWDREVCVNQCLLTCYGLEPNLGHPLQGYTLWTLNLVIMDKWLSGIPVEANIHIEEDDWDTMECWRTIAKMCQRGDILQVIWHCDRATMQELHEAGFSADVLQVVILRHDKEFASFRLLTHITPRDTVRMVRFERP